MMAHCDVCGRSFSRNEHLIRHHRTHTGERPFRCPHCNNGFHRADVREKHIEKIHREIKSPSKSSKSPHRHLDERCKPKGGKRSRLACDQCRKRKLKCNNIRPCESCRAKMLPCTVSSSSRPPSRPRNPVVISSGEGSIQVNGVDSLSMTPVTQPHALNSLEPPLVRSAWFMPGINEIGAPDNSDSTSTYMGAADLSPLGAAQWMTPEVTGSFPIQALSPSGPTLIEQIYGNLDLGDNTLPQIVSGNWMDDLNEFSAADYPWPPNSATLDVHSDPPTDGAIEITNDYFQRRSIAARPYRKEQRRSYHSDPLQLRVYDEDDIDVLLNLPETHTPSTFAISSLGYSTGYE